MKMTEELINEIRNSELTEKYLMANREEMRELSLSGYLNSLINKYDVKKSVLFRRAGQEGSTYGYELFRSDAKVPSRDLLLAICLAFPLEIDEVQYALRCAGLATLYPRDKRDAYILFGFKEKLSIEQLDEILENNGIKGLLGEAI